MTTATSRPARDPDAVDGRTARRLENRERILDAALELVAAGTELDMDAIAASANVSVRSVYNHFPTARHLVAGMYERGSERVRPYIAQLPSPSVPFEERVDAWVGTWGRIQDEIAPIRWQALIAEDKHPDLQPELAELRRGHRAEIRRMFPEICGEQTQAAALAITDSLTWRALRRHQGLSFDDACDVVVHTIKKLAGPD
jgi:AcrR family transcriptional regulator